MSVKSEKAEMSEVEEEYLAMVQKIGLKQKQISEKMKSSLQ